MQALRSSTVESRIQKVLARMTRRARSSAKHHEHLLQMQQSSNRRFRQEQMIERRIRKHAHNRRLDKGLEGLKILLSFAQSKPIRDILSAGEELHSESTGARFGHFVFYLAQSRREDAPDTVAIDFSLAGISVSGGCEASNDVSERAFFPFGSSDEILREQLERIVHSHETSQAFEILTNPSLASYEWSDPASDIGYQVLVDCRDPDRLEEYIEVSIKRLERSTRR